MHSERDPRIADWIQAGRLRVALGLGSPALAVKDEPSGKLRGPALDLAQALAARLGLDLVPIEYPRPGAVMEGVGTNAWDVTFLVIDATRAAKGDFSPPYMQSDFTYLVPPGSPVRRVVDADRTGLRITVPQGDASDHYLSSTLKRAELVRVNSLSAALDLIRTGRADAYAAGRPVLLSLAAQLPGSRVLADGFGTVSYAALVPKANPGHLAYISEFIEWAKASGLVKQTIERAGLRGVKVAPPMGASGLSGTGES